METTKTKVLLLARVGGGNRQELAALFAAQEKPMREYCDVKNYEVAHYLKMVGSRFPIEMITKKHKETPFDKLIVVGLDRVGRNRLDVMGWKSKLKQMGVEIESTVEPPAESSLAEMLSNWVDESNKQKRIERKRVERGLNATASANS